MSANQSIFIKWFFGIAAGLITSGIVGLIILGQIVAVNSEITNENKQHIEDVKLAHKADNDLIRLEMWNIRSDQKIIMNDIKEILKELK